MMSSAYHRCPVAGCQSMVPNSKLMCLPHWGLVSRHLQREVHHYHRVARNGPSHQHVIRQAVKAVEATLAKQVVQVHRQPYAD